MTNVAAKNSFDIIIVGAGIAGLWLANRLKRAGYNLIVIEKDKIGAGQTLASQGMIHGGQKYALQGAVTDHASAIAQMPERWDAAFGGWGEIDLTAVKYLSEQQIMWPAGTVLSTAAVYAAAKLVNAATKKLKPHDWPEILRGRKGLKGPVYALPEKVLDVRSLLLALMHNLKGQVLKGDITEILPDGQVAVNGQALQTQAIIFAAGSGNEDAFRFLKIKEQHAQRRPLRQVMVRGMEYPLFGHGIIGQPKPRLTVTSHSDGSNGYIWYLGGGIAEKGAAMSEEETILFAQKELADVFPQIKWQDHEFATWYGDRAEPFDASGQLPQGPFLHQRGRIVMSWPTKLTFAPALADRVIEWLTARHITPACHGAAPDFQTADIGSYPWETATWKKYA